MSYDSVRGRIATDWRREGRTFRLQITVPANTVAIVHMPAADARTVRESGRPAEKSEGVTFLRSEDGAAVYEVLSGEYAFRSTITAMAD